MTPEEKAQLVDELYARVTLTALRRAEILEVLGEVQRRVKAIPSAKAYPSN